MAPGLICVGIGVASALPAAYDAWKVVTMAIDQLRGPAFGADFLNLYAGAQLLLRAPVDTYRFDAQLALQRSLTDHENMLVPFYLPPYAALLLSWLGWLPYGIAYLVWLVGGVACVLLAAYLIAPHWTRWYPFVWFGLGLLFLPVLLGLAQGQTSALMLVCVAAVIHGFMQPRRSASAWLIVGLIGWTLKPQLAPLAFVALLAARHWQVLGWAVAVLGVLGVAAGVRLGQAGLAQYAADSSTKMQEALSADPTFLLGPTLLHASHWFLGVNGFGQVAAAALTVAVLAAFVYLWHRGPASDDALLLQVAALPIAAVLVAPYALIYELTLWLPALWLLWRYTRGRAGARSTLLWLTAGVWVAANFGVGNALSGGADFAALLGLGLVAFIVALFHRHSSSLAADVDPSDGVARQSDAYLPIA